MELLKDGQISLNIDGFIISQNLHNKATATSLFGITNKNNLNIGHDDRTWVLEKDIICDTCNRCVGCQTCVSCNNCVNTVGCNNNCQGCTGSCTGCASGCYDMCFGDCYTCQDCQTGCTSCNACTAGCDGGCQTECYTCVSCDGCVGCDGDCVGCFNVCQESCQTCTSCASCTSCVSCQTGCQTGCFIVISPKPGTNCIVGCQTICQTCTGCDNNCYTGCTSCDGCTSGCTGGCQTGCQTGCTTACQICTGDTCDNCNSCNSCTSYNGGIPCSPCVGPYNCGQTPPGCPSCYGPSQNIICPSCNTSGQGGQSPCNNGCFSGEYTPPEPEQKEVDIDCLNRATGGTEAGLNTACATPPYNAADIKAPPEYKGPPAWNQLSDHEKVDRYREFGYKVNIKDTPEDITGVEFSTIKKVFPGADHVQTEWDEESGTFKEYVYDKNGKKLGTFKSTDRGETFEAESEPDDKGNVKKTTDIKVNKGTKPPTTDDSKSKTKEYDSKGKPTGKETGPDGTTVIVNPETGEKVNTTPQPAGC